MHSTDFVLLEEDHTVLTDILDRLRQEANAKLSFLLDRNGQQLARSGELDGVDPTSLASLAAGNVAATDGLAKLIGETEFSILFHEGDSDHLHITLVDPKAILVIRFDEYSSLGLVRLRVKQALAELEERMQIVMTRPTDGSATGSGVSPFAEITDEDIDNLFSV